MLGRRWTASEQKAYRGAFTLDRIVDEVWIVVAIVWFVLFCVFENPRLGVWSGVIYLGGFAVLGVGSYWLLPKFLKHIMPDGLYDSLPQGRFDGQSSVSAPRTYRELIRRWCTSRWPRP
jgi:hypothetical protein